MGEEIGGPQRCSPCAVGCRSLAPCARQLLAATQDYLAALPLSYVYIFMRGRVCV